MPEVLSPSAPPDRTIEHKSTTLSINPATDEVIGVFPLNTREDVFAAV